MDPANCNLKETLMNPEVLAALVPIGVLLAVLSTASIFITLRVLYTIFVGTSRRVLKPKRERRKWFGKNKTLSAKAAAAAANAVVVDKSKELLAQNRSLEEAKAVLQAQYEKSTRRVAELEDEVRSLEGQLVRQREEIAIENEKLTELRRHAERLETQLEEAVIEVNRIYRNAPGALVGNTAPQPAPQPEATPEQMQKLKEILSTYTDRLDKPESEEP